MLLDISRSRRVLLDTFTCWLADSICFYNTHNVIGPTLTAQYDSNTVFLTLYTFFLTLPISINLGIIHIYRGKKWSLERSLLVSRQYSWNSTPILPNQNSGLFLYITLYVCQQATAYIHCADIKIKLSQKMRIWNYFMILYFLASKKSILWKNEPQYSFQSSLSQGKRLCIW